MPLADGPYLAIFDHDGVLVDTLELHQYAWLELGHRTGLPVTAEFIHDTFGMTNLTILGLLTDGKATAEDCRHYIEVKEAIYRELAAPRIALMPGVRALLNGLSSAGFRLAIGSSAVRPNLDLTIDRCGLSGRFDAIASVEDIERGKPDPQVFLVAARKAGVSPERSVVFEDATFGIQAAKAAGMWAVGVLTTHNAQSLWDAGADEVVETLMDYDVNALVRRLASRADHR